MSVLTRYEKTEHWYQAEADADSAFMWTVILTPIAPEAPDFYEMVVAHEKLPVTTIDVVRLDKATAWV